MAERTPTRSFASFLHGSGTTSTGGWTDTYDITGVDVLQAIDWAQRQAGTGFTYAVALVCEDKKQERTNPGFGRGLVWLVGIDGNDKTAEGLQRSKFRAGCFFAASAPSGSRRRIAPHTARQSPTPTTITSSKRHMAHRHVWPREAADPMCGRPQRGRSG